LQTEVFYFNTAKNLDYVGAYPEPKYYGADNMSGDERVSSFLLFDSPTSDGVLKDNSDYTTQLNYLSNI
jgi:hypothetical protein